MRLEGIVSKRKASPYRQRAVGRLAQEQEPGVRGSATRGGGGLGQTEIALIGNLSLSG
jgi:hypothetical protein